MCRLGQFFSPYTSHSSLQTLCSWHQLVTRFCDAGKNLRLPLPLDYFHRFICVWIFYLSSFFQCFVIAHQKAQFGVSSPRSFPGGDALQTHQPSLACSNYWMLIYTQLATWIIFLNLGGSSRGGRQKLILEIITLMVNPPSGSHQQSSCAAG